MASTSNGKAPEEASGVNWNWKGDDMKVDKAAPPRGSTQLKASRAYSVASPAADPARRAPLRAENPGSIPMAGGKPLGLYAYEARERRKSQMSSDMAIPTSLNQASSSTAMPTSVEEETPAVAAPSATEAETSEPVMPLSAQEYSAAVAEPTSVELAASSSAAPSVPITEGTTSTTAPVVENAETSPAVAQDTPRSYAIGQLLDNRGAASSSGPAVARAPPAASPAVAPTMTQDTTRSYAIGQLLGNKSDTSSGGVAVESASPAIAPDVPAADAQLPVEPVQEQTPTIITTSAPVETSTVDASHVASDQSATTEGPVAETPLATTTTAPAIATPVSGGATAASEAPATPVAAVEEPTDTPASPPAMKENVSAPKASKERRGSRLDDILGKLKLGGKKDK